MNNKIMKSGLAAMMAASLVGCSSSSSDNSNNVLTVGITAQMNGVFSPLYYESAYDAYAINLMYQSMLQYDENEELQPVLAKELPTISDDGQTVTFKLNKGVKFSDGSKLTSSDVKYTFTVLADPSYTGRFSSDVENIEGYKEYHDGDATELSGIETPDDYTVVFHMTQPRIDAVTTFGTRAICSDTQYKYKKGHISKIEKDTSNPIGSGAYKLNKYSKATGASFVRNENFKAKKGEYSIDKVIIKVCSTSTELNEFNEDKANQILDEAGWEMADDGYRYKDGQKLSIRFMIAEGSSSLETLIPMIEKTYKDIGVDLKQTILEFNSLLSKTSDDSALGEWEMSCLAMSFTGVANTDLNSMLKTGDVNNYARLSNSELDSLLDEAMYTTDEEKSTELYKQVVIKENDLLPYLALYGNQNFNLYNKRVKNMKTGPIHNWSQAMDTATLD